MRSASDQCDLPIAAMAAMEKQCTVLIADSKQQPGAPADLRNVLEKGKPSEKIVAMKKTILLLIQGEILDGFLMTIIRFVLPQEDHALKKLSLMYLEIVDKTDKAGKLLPEFILVCNQILNDLNHPNEHQRDRGN